jgi:hypothetical protein
MRTQPHEVRCKNPNCHILLGELDETGLTIRRNDIEVHYAGPGNVSIRCYRPRCRRMNVVRISTAQAPESAAM